MEKKYPCIKCNKELWAEIKPILESFGIRGFYITENTLASDNNHIVSNFGNPMTDDLIIGNTIYDPDEKITEYLRYLVDTKEEFLSAVAKLLGKEYSIKEETKQVTEETKQVTEETKYPCIKCTQQLYDKIKYILINIGYKESNVTDFKEEENLLTINVANVFGQVSNVRASNIKNYNRYECSDIREFLTKACELKGFEVVYNTFVTNNDAENHYFKYIIDKENKTVEINETNNDKGECSLVINDNNKQWKKKPKSEDIVVSYDPAIGESSTVVAIMPTKNNNFDKNKEDMEKINIANKLRYCKKGTKLYHLMFGEVEFDGIDNDDIFVITTNKDNEKGRYYVNSFGLYDINYPNGECLLFPSKDNRDWNDFQVLEKHHRVMVSNNGSDWNLRLYISDDSAVIFNSNNENEFALTWKYIVPIEEFDFLAEDITINKEKSII